MKQICFFLIYREWRNLYIFFNLFNLNRVYHFKEIVIQCVVFDFIILFSCFLVVVVGKIFSLSNYFLVYGDERAHCQLNVLKVTKNRMRRSKFQLNWQIEHFNKLLNYSNRFFVLDASLSWKKQPCDIRHFIWLHSLKWIRQMPFRVFALNFFSSAISLIYLASGRNNSWCQFKIKKTIIKFAVIWIYSTESNAQTCHLKCTSKWKMTCPKAKTHAK